MAAPTLGIMPPDSKLAQTLKYLYFMRFSIMLWAFLPALAALDKWSGIAGLTRGIVALEDGPQLLLAGFFVTITGWVALLSARITSAYGQERFCVAPPPYFAVGQKMSHWAFWLAQAPGFLLLAYVCQQTTIEQDASGFQAAAINAGWLLLGACLALLCWFLMAGIYYWLFWTGGQDKRSPNAFVMPYRQLFTKLEDRPPSAGLLALLDLFEKAAVLGNGYADPKRGQFKVHSGHALAFLTLVFLATIYLAFWDFTAPVPLERVRLIVLIIFGVAALIWIWLTFRAAHKYGKKLDLYNLILMLVLFAPMILVVSLPVAWGNHPFAMPVLGFVTVLAMFVLWGLSGLAFFLDRFRVPVLTLLGLVFLVANLLAGYTTISGDHYLNASKLDDKITLLTPDKILDAFEQRGALERSPNAGSEQGKNVRPVIVITATGGGIHAAAWTTRVLQAIEADFKKYPETDSFHDSILLMSTVSGGSVGTAPWLTNYRKASGFESDTAHRIAECSDLQAVAWGLTYADFLRILVPLRWSELGKTLNTYDRGWALEKAFWRNRDTGCDHGKAASVQDDTTVGTLANVQNMPAFSFNTTAEETGSRWLIANYVVEAKKETPEITPAAALLHLSHSDVALSTAARMSANFPYVSPMARLKPPAPVYHFGDGGYFDNDGTSTAMEFLWYALTAESGAPRTAVQAAASTPRIPILVLEIRDGPDPDEKGDDPNLEEGKWSPLSQGAAPLVTFYNAGHVSVTRRNRRELCFLENALRSKAHFTHIVVPYVPDAKKECPKTAKCPAEPQPLSWHLTAHQKNQIGDALNKIDVSMVRHWYEKARQEAATASEPKTRNSKTQSAGQATIKSPASEQPESFTCGEKVSAVKEVKTTALKRE